MRRLDRYVAVNVIRGTLLALVILVSLFTFIAFVDDLGTVGRGDYTMAKALEYLVLTTPRRVFELFPVAALIGSLVGLGTLASSSELTVMRAAGVSLARITLAVMKGGAVLMVLAVIVGEFVAPISERTAQHRRSVAMSKQIALSTNYGFWVRDGLSFINIRQVMPGNRMGEMYIFEFDSDRRLRLATRAENGTYQDGRWLLEGITQSRIGREGVEVQAIKAAGWNSLFVPDLVDVVAVKPESLSALGLVRYLGYLRENGLSTTRYELALWSKLVYPLATGVMLFLAVPLVMGSLRTVGIGQRILAGVLMGVTFHIVHQSAVSVGIVVDANPLMAAFAPTLGFFVLGVWLMRQVR